MVKSFTLLWNLNPAWRVFDHARPDPLNPRYIRMNPETGYRSNTMLRFMADHRYQIELTPRRDKHAVGIAERTVGIITAKKTTLCWSGAPPSFWCWAMFKTTQDLNLNYRKKIDTSPYNFITGRHTDINSLHSFFAVCYMHIPLKDRTSKLPTRRAQRCRFLAYFTCISRSKTGPANYRPAVHRGVGSWPTRIQSYSYLRMSLSSFMITIRMAVHACLKISYSMSRVCSMSTSTTRLLTKSLLQDITSRILAPNKPV